MTMLLLWTVENYDTLQALLRAALLVMSGGDEATGPWPRA